VPNTICGADHATCSQNYEEDLGIVKTMSFGQFRTGIHTRDAIIRASSHPNPRTRYNRTNALSETVTMDIIIITTDTTKMARLRPTRGIG
jgi:hypothetical protein